MRRVNILEKMGREGLGGQESEYIGEKGQGRVRGTRE